MILLLAGCTLDSHLVAKTDIAAIDTAPESDPGWETAAVTDSSPQDTAPLGQPCDGGRPRAVVPEADPECADRAPVPLDPVIEWQSAALSLPGGREYTHPYAAPIVAPLYDTNGDDVVGGGDVPAIVYVAYHTSSIYDGVLRALAGDGSGSLLAVEEVAWEGWSTRPAGLGGVAVGDLDGDREPEIVAPVLDRGGDATCAAVFDGSGALRWVNCEVPLSMYAVPTLGDLDADGRAEVVFGANVYEADGALRFAGSEGQGAPPSEPSLGGIASLGDLDGDGLLEVVAGRTAYRADGTIFWDAPVGDGYSAIADLDGDGSPEVIVSSRGNDEVACLDASGGVVWARRQIEAGGAPMVVDLDGDGDREVVVPGAKDVVAYGPDGATLWAVGAYDSSGILGVSAFDSEADGLPEVLYADSGSLQMLDGLTGATRWEDIAHASGTATEYPTIADVDGDGASEIVVASTDSNGTFCDPSPCWDGITVIGNLPPWPATRHVWHQHAYHVTNIEDDLTVPAREPPAWEQYNIVRATPPADPAGPGVDLRALPVGICLEECSDGRVTFYVEVSNRQPLPAGRVMVRIVDADGDDVAEAEEIPELGGPDAVIVGPWTLPSATMDAGARVRLEPEAAWCAATSALTPLGSDPCP